VEKAKGQEMKLEAMHWKPSLYPWSCKITIYYLKVEGVHGWLCTSMLISEGT